MKKPTNKKIKIAAKSSVNRRPVAAIKKASKQSKIGHSFARVGLFRTKHKHQAKHIKFAWATALAFLTIVLPQLSVPLTKTKSVLSYATGLSTYGLLDSTNGQRASNGVGNLSINSKLNNAAQAKANDMATRNYWSHNTPEGNPPWIFFTNAGYTYSKAGENLAYGFTSNDDVIVGWMNSASHRANMLDGTFTEVGFGFANNSNYQNNGEQTIVVAEYAKPYYAAPATCPVGQTGTPPNCVTPQTVAPKATTAPKTTTAPKATPKVQQAETQPSAEQPIPEAPKPEEPKPPETLQVTRNSNNSIVPVYTVNSTSLTANKSIGISRIQQFTKGKAPWINYATTTTMFVGFAVWAAKHAYVIRRVIVEGESFVIHHPVLDVMLIIFVVSAYLLTRNIGFIR